MKKYRKITSLSLSTSSYNSMCNMYSVNYKKQNFANYMIKKDAFQLEFIISIYPWPAFGEVTFRAQAKKSWIYIMKSHSSRLGPIIPTNKFKHLILKSSICFLTGSYSTGSIFVL